MAFPSTLFRSKSLYLFAAAAALGATPALSHEAWLLTPSEIEALSLEPNPAIFQSRLVLGGGALIASFAAALALNAEDRFRHVEDRLASPLAPYAVTLGALILRLGLAAMVLLAATGGLPRHGVVAWTQPTLFVPDMQLQMVPGWDWLIAAQALIGLALTIGFGTRLCGLALIGLSGLGLGLFGMPFLSYAPHFAAPGLMLALIGGGAFSVDRLLEDRDVPPPPPAVAGVLWRAAQAVVGLGFVYLSVAYKLTQPTLLIAILEHGNFPSFGIGLDWIALIMTGVEITCGLLLALGRLTRVVALVLIGAISFLAVTLGETPLFHANLYGMMAIFALAGPRMPVEAPRGVAIFGRVEA